MVTAIEKASKEASGPHPEETLDHGKDVRQATGSNSQSLIAFVVKPLHANQ